MRLSNIRDLGDVLVRVSLLLMLVLVPLLSSTEVFATHVTLKVAALLPLSGLLLLTVALSLAGTRLTLDRVDGAAVVFGFALILAAVFSPSPVSAIFGPYNQSTGLLVLLAGIIGLVSARRLSPEQRSLAVWLLVLGALLVAVLMLAQQAGVRVVVEALGVPTTGRPQATLGNPIHAGMFTAVGLIAAVGILSERSRSTVVQAGLGAALVVLAAALVLSFSRGAWLASLAGLVSIAWRSPRVRGYRPGYRLIAVVATAIVLLAVGALVVNPESGGLSLSGRLLSSDEASQQSGRYRLGLYEVAWHGLLDRPLLGYGPGNYGIAWQKHVDQEMLEVHPDAWAVDSHGLLFELAATGGVLVLVSFLVLTVLLSLAWRRRRESPSASSWLVSLPAGMVAGLLFSTQHPYLTPLLFLLAGLVTPTQRFLPEEWASEGQVGEWRAVSHVWPGFLMVGLGLLFLLTGGYTGISMVAADARFLDGTSSSNQSLLDQSTDEFPYYARPKVEKGLRLSRSPEDSQKQLAVEAFHEALKVEPRNAYILHVLTATLFDLGELDAALRRSNETLDAFPLYADARLLRANIALALGDKEEVLENVNRSLAIGVPSAQRFYQGAIITGRVDRAAARDMVDRALERYPTDQRLLQLKEVSG